MLFVLLRVIFQFPAFTFNCSDLLTMLAPAGRSVVIVGDGAQLLGLLLRARARISPEGLLDLDATLPYRAVSYGLYVTATSIIRGVLSGWARVARRSVARFGPAAVLRTGPALAAAASSRSTWSPEGPPSAGSSSF